MCIEKTPWEQVIEFHGHTCPGIALGYRIAQIANRELSVSDAIDAKVLVTSYTHSCALDAFQIINRATYGRGNLNVIEHNQHIYYFQRKGDSEKLQITIQSDILNHINESEESLSSRERQARNLEAIRLILSTDELQFCKIEYV